jgi:hypothetical protein
VSKTPQNDGAPGVTAKVKKGRVHQHVGKPAEHVFPKALRALAPWAPKAEAAILKARREAPKGGTR